MDQRHAALTPPFPGRLLSLDDIPPAEAKILRWVVSDIDDTLTDDGRMNETTVEALGVMHDCGLEIILATGRSAAIGHALAVYLPFIRGVICENGALYFAADQPGKPELLRRGLRAASHRRELEAAFARLRTIHPALRRTDDDVFRLTELAMVNEPWITDAVRAEIAGVAAEHRLDFTYSSIHLHLMAQDVSKWAMVRYIAQEAGLADPLNHIITVGDSINDATLFDPRNVACSVGVAQAATYLQQLGDCIPRYLATEEGVQGFRQVAVSLSILRSRRSPA